MEDIGRLINEELRQSAREYCQVVADACEVPVEFLFTEEFEAKLIGLGFTRPDGSHHNGWTVDLGGPPVSD